MCAALTLWTSVARPQTAASCPPARRLYPAADSAGVTSHGETAVDWQSGYPLVLLTLGNVTGWALLDLGASLSMITPVYLPGRISAFSPPEPRIAVIGVGGDAGLFERVRVSHLRSGSIDYGERDILVARELPLLFGRPVQAIVGLDLLATAGRVRFQRQGAGWRVTLGPQPASAPPADSVDLAFTGALLGATATVDTSTALLVLDTGSFRTFLDPGMAYRARFDRLKDDDDPPFGLDGRPVPSQTAVVRSIALGQLRWRDVDVGIARLTSLRPEGHPPTVDGLLGSDLLKRLGAFEVDFRCGVLRLWR